MVEVHQRNQAVLARSVAEHRQQARLITEHIRQPPTGANPYLTDRGRPWRVRHAGRRQRRRRAGCGVTLCRGDPEDHQRPQQGHCLLGASSCRVADRTLPEDGVGVLAGRQSLPPGSEHLRGEHLHVERVGRPHRRSERAQQFGVNTVQARQDTPGAARTGGRTLLLAPAADGTHRPDSATCRVGPSKVWRSRGSADDPTCTTICDVSFKAPSLVARAGSRTPREHSPAPVPSTSSRPPSRLRSRAPSTRSRKPF
jgi:hypothetical protein